MSLSELVKTLMRVTLENLDIKNIDSTITLKYRDQWGIWECIREIYQNAIDTVEEISGEYVLPNLTGNGEYSLISDKGEGLTLRQFFLMGVSEKHENARGQFGEGLKIGLSILLRNGFEIVVRSKNWIAIPKINEIFGEKILSYEYAENLAEISGTHYLIKGLSVDKINEVINGKFLNPNMETIVSLEGFKMFETENGNLFNKGIYVMEMDSFYGYDMDIVLGTDRNMTDTRKIKDSIGIYFDCINDKKVIKNLYSILMDTETEYLEGNLTNYCLPEYMKTLFQNEYGKNACIINDMGNIDEIKRFDGNPILISNIEIYYGFQNLGIETGYNFRMRKSEELDEKSTLVYSDLEEAQKDMLKESLKIINSFHIFGNELLISEESKTWKFYNRSKSMNAIGYCKTGTGIIGLSLELFSDLWLLIEVIIHEYTHKFSHYSDCSNGFQGKLDQHIKQIIKVAKMQRKMALSFNAKIKINKVGKWKQYIIRIPKKELSETDIQHLENGEIDKVKLEFKES
jgi:hypothetical protein